MKKKIFLGTILFLILVLAGFGYYYSMPRPIIPGDQADGLKSIHIYYAQDPEMVTPPPYESFARLTHIVSSDFDKAGAGAPMTYSAVYEMDEILETQLRDLLKETQIKRDWGSAKVPSDQYICHLEGQLPKGDTLHIYVGSKSLPSRVEINGHGYQIEEERDFREAFEESVWDYLTAQILERSWEGVQSPREAPPNGWYKKFTKENQSITVQIQYYRSMESGNLSVSYDGANFVPIGEDTIMYGVKGQSSVRSAKENCFCEYDGDWLYISGLDLAKGSHVDRIYKVNLKTGRTAATNQRAPWLPYAGDQPLFYHRQ